MVGGSDIISAFTVSDRRHPSPPSGGEGPLRSAKQGAGGVVLIPKSRSLRFALAPAPCRFAAVPLPLKGARECYRLIRLFPKRARGYGLLAYNENGEISDENPA
jgi:hypothetical protein